MKRVNMMGVEEENESPCNKNPRRGPAEAVRLLESHILTNPSITDRIFADISYSDLLNFCLISKAWNLTCRGILVDRFDTSLTLSEQSTVQVLEDFYNLISSAVPGHTHPVSGIRVNFSRPVREWPFSSEPFVGLISRIMRQIEVKFVSFEMSKLDLKSSDFHDIFETLVIPHLGTIKTLAIVNFNGHENWKTLTEQLSVDSLTNLKELYLDESRNPLKPSTFEKILRACPNLKHIPCVFPYQLPTLINTNNMHLASKVEFDYMKLTPKDIQLLVDCSRWIKELKISQQKKAKKNKFEGDWISRLEPIFSSDLKVSLELLDVSLELLVAILLQNSFPPLTKLKELSCTGSQEWFPSLVKSSTAQLANFMPNLRSLTVCWAYYGSNFLKRNFEDDNEAGPLSLYQLNTAASLDSVRTLVLSGIEHRRDEKYETLMKLMSLEEAFPCVTHLEINFHYSDLEDLFKWICESWGDLLETLMLHMSDCSRLIEYAVSDFEEPVPHVDEEFLEAMQHKRKTLPVGVTYSDKLCHLRLLEVAFYHPPLGICEQDYEQETTEVRTTFKPRDGQEVQVLIFGCRAQKRLARIKCGVSVYETLLALRSCPQDLELSPFEEIIATESICKKICLMLPYQDLLSVSVVNRRWMAAARKELHERGSCTLTINPLTYKNSDTPSKITWLRDPGVEFYSALRIKAPLSSSKENASFRAVRNNRSYLELDDLKHTRFNVLQISGLQAADAHSDHFNRISSELRNFIKSLLLKLELDHVEILVTSIENFDRLFRDEEGKLLVPNLRCIKLVDPELLLDYPEVTKRLFEELTFLERINNHFSNKLLSSIASVNKAHCVKHIQLYELPEKETLLDGEIRSQEENSELMTLEDQRTSIGSLLKFAQEHQPRVEAISVANYVRLTQKNEPVLRKLFQILCISAYESIRLLSLNLSHLHLVSKVYTRPMLAVKHMNLEYDQGSSDPDRLLSQIPLHEMFPGLTQVCLQRSTALLLLGNYWYVPDTSSPEENQPATYKCNPQPCLSVRSMTFRVDSNSEADVCYSSLKPWSVESLARVFPNVDNLTFIGSIGTDSTAPPGNKLTKILSSIWQHWSNLERFTCSVSRTLDAVAFETWILGISEEEWSAWKELQGDGSTGELVKTMHYAPSTLSFRNCTSLKEFGVNANIETVIVKRTKGVDITRLRLFPQILEEKLDEAESEEELDEAESEEELDEAESEEELDEAESEEELDEAESDEKVEH